MKVIGLMSGTSADGMDIALCEIHGAPPQLHAQIRATHAVSFSREMRERILRACAPDTSRVDEICYLNVDLANWFADAILELLQREKLTPQEVDLIGSHGQTLWHAVNAAGHVDATLQIVSAGVLAERTGITTISNFRERDVAAGGQGAPLTGYVDWLLLRHPTRWRAVQNIGGMGNVSFLPPLSDPTAELIAFDTGPGNALIDIAAGILTNGAQTYDADGHLAAHGTIDEVWLDDLLQHPFIQRGYPKTTGRETFGTAFAQALVEQGQQQQLAPETIMATLTMFTATSIAQAYQTYSQQKIDEVILGGGGRHNATMVAMLRDLLYPVPVLTHEDIGLDSDFKEALVFAVLAYETWHGRTGTLPSQTGASHATILGQITPGNNFLTLNQRTWSTSG